MIRLECFFDCSSPWTYLGFEEIQRSAREVIADGRVDLVWRPFLVGGVFNTVNPSVYEARANPVPVKSRYYGKDLADWARYVGIEIGQPPVFPVNSVKAMRGAFFAIEQGCLEVYARVVFRSYWTELRDISQDDVLTDVVNEVGLNRDAYFAAINDAAYKAKLRENTDELIARGGFGSPTFFIDETDMYFGNDRIPLVMARIGDLMTGAT